MIAGVALALALTATSASGDAEFRAICRTLVETDTSTGSGDCTLAATPMAEAQARGGVPAADIRPYSTPAHRRGGGLVVVARGSDRRAPDLLLVAHIDVVDANGVEWRPTRSS